MGRITLEPFDVSQVNPNSYNYRLGETLLACTGFSSQGSPKFEEVKLSPLKGYTLVPGTMYLGVTAEKIGSTSYAMSLIGRSSIGRLGLFVQISANLGHTASSHRWTLELKASIPIRVYAGMVIGQVSFWTNLGTVEPYIGFYSMQNLPTRAVPLQTTPYFGEPT